MKPLNEAILFSVLRVELKKYLGYIYIQRNSKAGFSPVVVVYGHARRYTFILRLRDARYGLRIQEGKVGFKGAGERFKALPRVGKSRFEKRMWAILVGTRAESISRGQRRTEGASIVSCWDKL